MEAAVVLSSYNGAGVIERQLDSLRFQSWPVRVLVRDDCSTDGTAQIVEEYISRHHLEGWRLIRNRKNLGWKRNFMEGMRDCGGDVVFPCDQDDVWYPDKVEKMMRRMEQHPEILLLSCDMRVVYEPGAVRARVYHRRGAEKALPVGRYRFTRRFFMNPRPGCSYAVRRSFLERVESMWQEDFLHDEFLWLMAAEQDGAYFDNEGPLMDYIRGTANASDIRYKDIKMQKRHLAYVGAMLSCMEQFAGENPGSVPRERLKLIRRAKIWCAKRTRLMETGNPLRWVEMMPYWGYYNSPKNCLSDLVLVLFGSFRRRAI